MFKVGDRVKVAQIVLEEEAGDEDVLSYIGQVGPVVEVNANALLYPFWVKLPDGQARFREEELVFTPRGWGGR